MFAPRSGDDRKDRLEGLRLVLAVGEVPTSAVKARREELRMSQRDLARASGVSQPVISRVEAGERMLTGDVARKLSAALKMGEQDLGLKESLSLMKRLAVEGRLPPEAAARIALRLLETQPTSEAGRSVNDAALKALAQIAETAAVEEDAGEFIQLQMRQKTLPRLIREETARPVREEIERLERELAALEEELRRAREEPPPDVPPERSQGGVTPALEEPANVRHQQPGFTRRQGAGP